MSTVLIVVALIVVIAVAVAAVLYGTGKGGGRAGLKRRFGPEYERAVNRHHGDAKAAENELTERVRRHGDLRPRPCPPKRATSTSPTGPVSRSVSSTRRDRPSSRPTS